MKQLRIRILGFFSLILILFSLLFMYLISTILVNQVVEQQGEDLQSQLVTLTSQIDEVDGTEDDWSTITSSLAQTEAVIDERITFISLTGDVIYDTHADQTDLENHFERPEIQQILEGDSIGTYNRESTSTGEVQYYAATPLVDENNERIGFLRLSKNVEDMVSATTQVIQIMAVFMVASILVTLLLTHYWTKRISDSISEMKNVTKELSNENYSARYNADSYNEIDELGQSINDLASNLGKQIEEIKQNDTRLREMINHLVIGVMVVDNNRLIDMVNPVMNEILGEDLYGNIGTPYNEGVYSAGLVEMIEKAYEKNRLQNKEITVYYPEEKIVDVNVVPILGEDEEPINYIVLLYDITEIRRLEKVRTDFVANVSHELRTPITAVKGFSETLLDGAMNEEDVLVEFLEIIHKESTRLDTMVQDILQLSKLEQRDISKAVEKVNIKDVIEDVRKILHQKLQIKEITLDVIVHTEVVLKMDRDQLKQIILNLVANAVAYTPKKGKVTIKVNRSSHEAMIAVEDNGIGIPEDKQSRIFERFYRVDKARSRNAGGTGLGLSIVKWLLENNNGRITLESEENKGTTFTVWLPFKQ